MVLSNIVQSRLDYIDHQPVPCSFTGYYYYCSVALHDMVPLAAVPRTRSGRVTTPVHAPSRLLHNNKYDGFGTLCAIIITRHCAGVGGMKPIQPRTAVLVRERTPSHLSERSTPGNLHGRARKTGHGLTRKLKPAVAFAPLESGLNSDTSPKQADGDYWSEHDRLFHE